MSQTQSKPMPLPTMMGPDGKLYVVYDLPRAGEQRWTSHQKKIAILGVLKGLLTFDQAVTRYGVDAPELWSWNKFASSDDVAVAKSAGLLPLEPPPPASRKPPPVETVTVEEELIPEHVAGIVQVGELSVDLDAKKVHVAGVPVKLVKMKYRVVEILAKHPGKIISRHAFFTHLYADRPKKPREKIVDQLLFRVREAFADVSRKEFIENVWGKGHRLRNPDI